MTSDPLFIDKAVISIKEELKSFYSADEIQQLIFLIFEHLTDFSRTDVLTAKNKIIPVSKIEQINRIIFLLKKYMPIEYIIGKTTFYFLDFKISQDVLIPRPETEELVEWIIRSGTVKSPKVLDIGTGSGCIAVSLAKNLENSSVEALDTSASALTIAKMNSKINKTKIKFINDNILLPGQGKGYHNYDLIVSNPPYVMESEKESMKSNVLCYEPPEAIFVPDDSPLIFYESIVNFANNHLSTGGLIYFEINQRYSVEITLLLNRKGFNNVVVRKDINDKFRFIKASREV